MNHINYLLPATNFTFFGRIFTSPQVIWQKTEITSTEIANIFLNGRFLPPISRISLGRGYATFQKMKSLRHKTKELEELNDLIGETDKPEVVVALTQAGRILLKFGGPKRLSEILLAIGRPRTYATVFRWDYPKEKGGTGGWIPGNAWPDIFAAARFEGLILTSEDIDPRQRLMNKQALRAYPARIRKPHHGNRS